MNTARREINFTGRMAIDASSIKAAAVTGADGQSCQLEFQLSLRPEIENQLPPNASIYVDAFRDNVSKRFSWGTVATPVAPIDRALDHLDATDGFYLKVTIVVSGNADLPGRIAAVSSRLALSTSGTSQQSLLPNVGEPEMVGELWQLSFQADGPVVKVNSQLVSDRHSFVSSPAFLTLAMPVIIREVLTWAIGDGRPSEEDWTRSRGHWLVWALDLIRSNDLPEDLYSEDQGQEGRQEFITHVLREFDDQHKLMQKNLGVWLDQTKD
jgi:hypothetical protein